MKAEFDTETIDRLFLELSQFTGATTGKELLLEARICRLNQAFLRYRQALYDAATPDTVSLYRKLEREFGDVINFSHGKQTQPSKDKTNGKK